MNTERIKSVIEVLVLVGFGGLISVTASEPEGITSSSHTTLEVGRIEELSLDLELTGTIIRSDASKGRVLFVRREGQLEGLLSIGDSIAEGVILTKIERTDMEQFYSSEEVLLEGAAAKHYDVDLDSGPVQEVLDLDERLALVPDDVKMKNGIPTTWWNPRGLKSMGVKSSSTSGGKTSTAKGAVVGHPD